MVQQARARVTRENIMLGAAEVIRRVGYANASLSDISAAAGVTKGALYFHFESKEAIARALVDEQHRRARDGALAILAEEAPALEQMMLLCQDLAAKLVDDPIVRAGIRLTTDSSTFATPVQEPYLDWMATFELLAGRAEADGETNGKIPPAVLARFVIPAYTGVQLVSETFTGRADLAARIHEMWVVLIAAIVPEPAQAAALTTAERVFAAQPVG